MIALLLLTIFLPPMLTDVDFLSKTCETVFTNLKCQCKDGENLILPPIFNDIIKKIKIRGCSNVSIPFASLNNLQLEELEFLNIERLYFEFYALASINDITSIRIENVTDLDFDVYSTKGMKGVKNFVIKNSFVSVLRKESFSFISNISYMLIENMTFKSVEELAFNIHTINTLHVKNSRFKSFENASIYIHDSEEVLFENCEFSESVDNTFGLDTVDSLTFQGCTFGALASTFIHSKDIKTLTFTNCTIEEIMPGAFAAVEVLEKVTFKNNTVRNVSPDSLPPFLSYNYTTESEYCCNYFPCDCSMYWMWEYNAYHPNISVFGNSLCIDHPMKDLSMYVPIVDSNNNCSALDLKVIESTPFPSVEPSNLPNMISLTVQSQGVSQILNPGMLSFCVSYLTLLNVMQHF